MVTMLGSGWVVWSGKERGNARSRTLTNHRRREPVEHGNGEGYQQETDRRRVEGIISCMPSCAASWTCGERGLRRGVTCMSQKKPGIDGME